MWLARLQTTTRHSAGQRHRRAEAGTRGEVETCWLTGACVLPGRSVLGCQLPLPQMTRTVLQTQQSSTAWTGCPLDNEGHPRPGAWPPVP